MANLKSVQAWTIASVVVSALTLLLIIAAMIVVLRASNKVNDLTSNAKDVFAAVQTGAAAAVEGVAKAPAVRRAVNKAANAVSSFFDGE